ncbi:MAG: hypothetical protein INQ03_21275 [Candidatus Heimdallarchaeota archaeon]|nr:hypothetical protein [Candidatus Heimdallarchaeota archaeon]
MGLPNGLDTLMDEITTSDFQLTGEFSKQIREVSDLLQDDPEKLKFYISYRFYT